MTVRIGLGPGVGSGFPASDYLRWVDLCEESGIDSIWHSDQLLGQTLEPLATLAALAGRTRRMRFGTSALVIPFRDPVVLAKEIATVDFLSEGRLLPVFGVGIGTDPYWAATGTPAKGRGARSNEAIELVRHLLEDEQVSYAGKHFRYNGPGMNPRPAKPIPLWIGGNSDIALRRTAMLGDGWLGSMIGPARAGAARRGIEKELAAAGRTIDPDHYGLTLIMRIGSQDHPAVAKTRQRLAGRLPDAERGSIADILTTGTSGEIIAKLRRFVDAGISKFVLVPIADDIDDLIAQTAALASDVLPVIED